MKKLYISILLVAILLVSAAALIKNENYDGPLTGVMGGIWSNSSSNISFLADHSESIVTGQVIKILPSRWNTPDGRRPKEFIDKKPTSNEKNIYTDIIVKIDKEIRGKDTPAEVTVRILGGQVGEDTMITEDEAEFELGENVLLFLTKEDPFTDNSAGTHYRVTGWMNGKFNLINDHAIRPKLPKEDQDLLLEEVLKNIQASK